jgi:hypothetical protein
MMRELVRRSCFVAVVALLCFGPSAFAQVRVASSSAGTSFTRSVGAFVFNPFGEDRKKRRKVAASEGGRAALYLVFAGLACASAVVLRSRRAIAPKSV